MIASIGAGFLTRLFSSQSKAIEKLSKCKKNRLKKKSLEKACPD